MKKCFALILSVLMVLSIMGCSTPAKEAATPAGDTEAEFQLEVEGFQVGFSRQICNPTAPLPLQGFGNVERRYFTEILDDMTFTCVAISDGEGNHILWITHDLIQSNWNFAYPIMQVISAKTGIPESNIFISACHSHSVPSEGGGKLNPEASAEFKAGCIDAIINASLEALADRKPAEMYIGSAETENLNFTRHYYHITEDGEKLYFGDNFGTRVINATTQHATEVDETMHLLKFTREGGKDVIVANWRAHPHYTGGSTKTQLSPDYPASFRDALERQTGAHVAYYQGASGNVNSFSRIPSEIRTSDNRAGGAMMAEHAMDGLKNNMTKVDTGTIQVKHMDFYGEINHSMDHLVAQAEIVQSVWTATASWTECGPYMYDYGIRSPYQANAIIKNAKRTKEKDGLIRLNVVAIGDDFAFATYPGELFDILSVQMEEASPYATTMLVGYSAGHVGYLPAAIAFEYTSYETDITRFVQGTGEMVRDEYIRMLNELYGA